MGARCQINYAPPLVRGSRIEFTWTMSSEVPFYQQNQLYLDVGLDGEGDWPQELLCNVLLYALHTHWLFMAPVDVILPMEIAEADRGVWERLLRLSAATLSHHSARDLSTDVRILSDGHVRGTADIRTTSRGSAASLLSGGKESLVQAGLVGAFFEDPLLIFHQHSSHPRIPKAFKEIREMLPCRLLQQSSNLREIVNGRFLHQELGIHPNLLVGSMAQIIEAGLVLAGYTERIRHLFHGAERETHLMVPGRAGVFEDKALHNIVYQKVLEHFVREFVDIRITSPLIPLSNFQVQELLVRRFPGLLAVQESCFFGSWCSKCLKCFRIAAILAACEVDPRRVGIDLQRLLLDQHKMILKQILGVPRGEGELCAPNYYYALQIIKKRGLDTPIGGRRHYFARAIATRRWRRLLESVDMSVDLSGVTRLDSSLLEFLDAPFRAAVKSELRGLWVEKEPLEDELAPQLKSIIDWVLGGTEDGNHP